MAKKHNALKTFIAASVFATFAGVHLAEAQGGATITVDPVIGQDLVKAFNGTTMDGIYKLPRQRSGTDEFTETFNTDGSTVYREGDITDNGHWVIVDDTICFRYTGALSGVSCFKVFRSGTCYYSYAPDSITNGVPIDANRWSVKTIIRGDISTCDNLVS